jgi:hypothetical protein
MTQGAEGVKNFVDQDERFLIIGETHWIVGFKGKSSTVTSMKIIILSIYNKLFHNYSHYNISLIHFSIGF